MAFERLSSAHPLPCRPPAVWQDILKPAKGSLATRQGRSAGDYGGLTVGISIYIISILGNDVTSTRGNLYRTVVLKMKCLTIIFSIVSVSLLAESTNFTAKSSAEYLRLTPPVRVTYAGSYMDGGSIGISLADSSTNVFHMFEDHSLGNKLVGRKDLSDSLRRTFENGTDTEGRIYVGGKKPTRTGRLTSIEEGREIKDAVECLAVAWYQKDVPLDEQKMFDEIAALPLYDPRRRTFIDENSPHKKKDEPFESAMSRIYLWHAKYFISTKLKSKLGQKGEETKEAMPSARENVGR
jgi:hypothetical protein